MSNIVIDAFAWIEYLNGGVYSEAVERIIMNNRCFTCAITVSEVISKIIRKGLNEQIAIEAIPSLSSVMPIDLSLSIEAGRIHSKQRKEGKNFSFGDAYLLGCAKKINAEILTNDYHFNNLPKVIMLSKLPLT